ncbi:type VI secretion system Vgr family protein [Chitinophaga sp. RAB17]|uniref:type VI secretion system Vgr family protein n=1 Tax=Chitinophaga sp. RAB17 TaxID=3233049 RepID=UPI003F91F747
MSLHTLTTVSIAGQQFQQFISLRLEQTLDSHHDFELKIGYDWLLKIGKNILSASKAFLGKEVNIVINAVQQGTEMEAMIFNGIVMSISAGKDYDGTHGFCIIRGSGPSVLLDNDPHIQCFEAQSLSAIAQTALKPCLPYTASPKVAPETTTNLKYIVQYKESNFDFLHRLSQRFGEWFFYNGQQIVFGQYTGKKINLVHMVDLLEFELQLKVKSNNQLFNGYDYREHQVVQKNTQEQSSGNMDAYTQQVQSLSEKLYNKPSLFKMTYAFTTNAKAELDQLLTRQKKGRLADMVHLKGNSKNTAIRIGDTVSVKENVYNEEDHGEFFITAITHYCNGNGQYHNEFTGIPAEVAAPAVDIENFPHCEAQSATVVDNHDPKGLGRIKVKFKWQQQGSTPWLQIISPHGGGDKGFYMVPEKGEEVIVDFEGGNPELPMVMGTTYNGKAKSSFGNAGNDVKAFKTRSGISFLMNDAAGSVTINDPSGNQVIMHGNKHVTINAPEKLVINSKDIVINGSNSIKIGTGADPTHVVIDTTGNKIDIKSDTNSIHGKDNTITGTSNKVNGQNNHIQGESKLDGGNVFIN